MTAQGSSDGYIARLSEAGSLKWVSQFKGTQSTTVTGLNIDQSGNVFATGAFFGTSDFDPQPNGFVQLASTGNSDAFALALRPTGELWWANRFGGSLSDGGQSIAVDSAGNFSIADTTKDLATSIR